MLYLQHYKEYLRDIIPKGGNVLCSTEMLKNIISKGLVGNYEIQSNENERALDLLDEILSEYKFSNLRFLIEFELSNGDL